MLSGSREPVQVPQGPQEARIGVPFTVCISNICRAVVRPLSGVLVSMMGMPDRSSSCSVTFYRLLWVGTCAEPAEQRPHARARLHEDQGDLW